MKTKTPRAEKARSNRAPSSRVPSPVTVSALDALIERAATLKISGGHAETFAIRSLADVVADLARLVKQNGRRSRETQPTVEGYWWTRPDDGCLWRMVEISIHDGKCYIEEMGEDGRDTLPACPWWQWVGPIAPPNAS